MVSIVLIYSSMEYGFFEFTKKIPNGKKENFYCALKTAAALDMSVRKICKATETW